MGLCGFCLFEECLYSKERLWYITCRETYHRSVLVLWKVEKVYMYNLRQSTNCTACVPDLYGLPVVPARGGHVVGPSPVRVGEVGEDVPAEEGLPVPHEAILRQQVRVAAVRVPVAAHPLLALGLARHGEGRDKVGLVRFSVVI